MKASIAVLVVIAIGIAGYFLLAPKTVTAPTNEMTEETSNGQESPTSAMRVGSDAVIVQEQRPGTTLKGMVILSAPGYLVIHEDKDGEPGAIIGMSQLLPAGENADVMAILNRPSRDGETLHAMLHFEKGGNTTFSSAEDTPVPSTIGGPISGYVEISRDAPLEAPITI